MMVIAKSQITTTNKSQSKTYAWLTWNQLKRQYPDQWVLLLNPLAAKKADRRFDGGFFVAASTDQMGTLADSKLLPKGSKIALVYTGATTLPASMPICL